MSDNTTSITFNISKKTANILLLEIFLEFSGSDSSDPLSAAAHEFYMSAYSEVARDGETATVNISRPAAEQLQVVFVMTYHLPDYTRDDLTLSQIETREALNETYSAIYEALGDPDYEESAILSRYG